MKWSFVTLAVLACFVVGCSTMPEEPVPLAVGDNAPSFSGAGAGGQTVTLESLKGKWVVVYFYLKAGTPVCTEQACSVKASHKAISDLGAVVLGVSLDKMEKVKEFKAKNQLPFELISDADKKIARSFDSLTPGSVFARRQTFIIDPAGKVAYIYERVKPKVHGQEILDALKKLVAAPNK